MARPAAAFMQTGSMTVARDGHTATRLLDGRVLIAGGGSASAELYDPMSQTFTATGSMTSTRTRAALRCSQIRRCRTTARSWWPAAVKIAELYDPTAGTFTATGSMLAPHLGRPRRCCRTARYSSPEVERPVAELFDPSTGTFTATGSMTVVAEPGIRRRYCPTGAC